MRLLFTLIALIGLALPAQAAWGPACAPSVDGHWIKDGHIHAWFEDGKQIGAWNERTEQWWILEGDQWFKAQPPWAPQVNLLEEPGVIRPQVESLFEKYTVNGKPVSREVALSTVGKVPDDSALLRMTLIGTEQECSKALSDLPPDAKLVVQKYRPTSWAVSLGHRTDGHPTISIQAPDGKEESLMLAPVGQARMAIALTEAQRKWDARRTKDPNYSPSKTPDLSRPLASAVPPGALLTLGGAAAFGVLALMRKK